MHKSKPITTYRSHGVLQNGTELIQFAFEDHSRKTNYPKVDVHIWMLQPNDGSIIQFITKYMNIPEFQNLKVQQKFLLLGVTQESMFLEKVTQIFIIISKLIQSTILCRKCRKIHTTGEKAGDKMHVPMSRTDIKT